MIQKMQFNEMQFQEIIMLSMSNFLTKLFIVCTFLSTHDDAKMF